MNADVGSPANTTSAANDAENPTLPRIVGARVDRLRIAYRAPMALTPIVNAHGAIIAGNTYRIDGSKAGRHALGLAGPGVEVAASAALALVDLRAPYLATHTLSDAVAHASEVARTLSAGADAAPDMVWMLDLCVDIAASFTVDDLRALVTRLRNGDTWREHNRRGAAGPVLHGFSAGKPETLCVCFYDKVHNLRSKGATMAEVERAIWTRAGWDGTAPVWRVEFKLRGAVLTRYQLRDPAALPGRVDAVWRALTSKAVRLVVPTARTRRERCPLDSRWKAIQGARFVQGAPPLNASEPPLGGGVSVASMVGNAAACLRKRGVSRKRGEELIAPLVGEVGTPDDVATLPARLDRAWGPSVAPMAAAANNGAQTPEMEKAA